MKTRKPVLLFLLIVVLVASALGATPRPAHADTIASVQVTNLKDDNNPSSCSLRNAIIAINHQQFTNNPCKIDATTNTILLPDATVGLTVQNDTHIDGEGNIIDGDGWGDLDILRSINIKGSGPNSKVTWATTNTDRVFHIHAGARVVMDSFTITGGIAQSNDPDHGGGGILNDGGNLTLINMALDNNSAGVFRGGGVNNTSNPNSFLTVSNSTFTNNTASVGGGIYNVSHVMVYASLFDGNKATSGAGAGFYNWASTGIMVTINSSTFARNLGRAVENSGSLSITFLTVKDSTGYGLFLNAGSWTMLRGSILENPATPGQDCYRTDGGVYFLDAGYNLVTTTPAGPAKCDFPISTLINIPSGLASSEPVTIDQYAQTKLYTISTSSPEYNAIPISALGGCDFAEIPAASVPTGLTVPAVPGYDQLERTRPTGSGCDIGSYELGATRMSLYLPSMRKFR